MTVEPTAFVAAMSRHWKSNLHNVPSPELQSVWKQMSVTFNRQIENFGTLEGQRWKVLQPATGTGKSQGLAVYCAMLSGYGADIGAVTALEGEDHPGVLIVTRFIAQANEMAETINRLANREVAIAYHSENRVPASELRNYPILVITHSAYENSLDSVSKYEDGETVSTASWASYHVIGDGHPRKLTVIDEALDIIQEAQIDYDRVCALRMALPMEMEDRFPSQIAAIDAMIELLRKMALASEARADGRYVERERILWRRQTPMPPSMDMTELRKAIMKAPVEQRMLRRTDLKERARLQTMLSETLRDIQAVLDNWNWYARKLDDHTINTARLIVPEDINGAVVLDATASSNLVYQLFEDRVDVIPVPSNARSYKNVNLHVSFGHAVGKVSMTSNGKDEAPKLIANLKEIIGSDRRVLVCCHKNVEPHLIALDTGFSAFDVGHWGALDGRNDWSNHDTVVIFGLPYRDKVWSANAYMAIRGLQDDEWLNDPQQRSFRNYPDVRHALEVGQLVVSIVQAINRVRCRRTVDIQGNCAPTDAFILLPNGKIGLEVLDGIVREMPGINVKNWQYGEPKQRKPRRSNFEEALVRYAGTIMVGRYSASEVKQELGISRRQWDRMARSLSDPTSSLSTRLAEHGTKYVVEGKGRGAKAYLLKE